MQLILGRKYLKGPTFNFFKLCHLVYFTDMLTQCAQVLLLSVASLGQVFSLAELEKKRTGKFRRAGGGGRAITGASQPGGQAKKADSKTLTLVAEPQFYAVLSQKE